MDQRSTIEDLFIAAAELPRGEQSAWLENACKGDLVLRSEIDSLLRYDAENTTPLSRVVQESAVLLMQSDVVPGLRIGPWRVTELIGRGGMGAVYMAVRDDEQFTKQVAIKFIRRGMDTPGVVERFIRERQILATLEHPYIAKLLDGGTTSEGVPYIVMEYVKGTPVDVWCDQQNPTLDEICEMFRRICEAVSYAHRNLIVHRDLKPTNILVTPEDTPMLLDFGIAKLLDDAASLAATATGNWVLTPDYASPEQVLGHATTTATDVYSLGVVFYQLLTGARPYGIDSTSPLAAARTICEQQPLRPSSLKRDKKLRGDLDNIVLMALRKEPERRYTSVEQFSEDVRRYLRHLPVIAREDTLTYRAQKFVSRNRAAVLAAGVTAIALVAAVGATTVEARRAKEARVVAEGQRQTAVRERDRAEREHATANQQRDAAARSSAEATLHAKEADIQRKRAEARVGDLVELGNRSLLDVQNTLARIPGALEARKSLVVSTLRYLSLLEQTSSNDPAVLAVLVTGYTNAGDVMGLPSHPNLGDQKGAVEAYAKAGVLLTRLTKLEPRNPRVRLQAIGLHQRAGVVLETQGDTAGALAEYNAGLQVAEKLEHDFPTVAHAVVQIGIMEHALAMALASRDTTEAELHARRELKAYERANAMDPEEGATGLILAHTSVARMLTARERPADAAREYLLALAMSDDFLRAHPGDSIASARVASVCLRLAVVNGATWQPGLNNKAAAIPFGERALTLYEQLAAADKNNQKAAVDLANALSYVGAIQESGPRLERAIGLLERLLNANPKQINIRSDLSFAREYLGRVKFQAGDTAGAIAEYRKSLAEAQTSAGNTLFTQTLSTQHALSDALVAGGEGAKALVLAREAADTARRDDTHVPARLKPATLAWVGDKFRDANDIASACSTWREAEALEKNPQNLDSLHARLATCR